MLASDVREMRKIVHVCGISFLVSMIVFLSLISSVKAYQDCNEVWGNYSYAKVCGTYPKLFYPYYHVYHYAGIFECLKGRYHFIGWDKSGNVLYSVWGILQPPTMEIEWTSGLTYKIWTAETEVWAPYYWPPSPDMEYIAAFIGPPGTR